MEKKRQAANMIVKPPPESEDSERDTGEESDIDTDEDKSRDNRCRLKHYRRQASSSRIFSFNILTKYLQLVEQIVGKYNENRKEN